jgi:hypothetical protein
MTRVADMNFAEKERLFRAGRYRLRIQPNCTRWWSIADWIYYIDRYGKWLTRPLSQDSV